MKEHLTRRWKKVLVAGAMTALVAGMGSTLPSAYAGGTIKADDDKWISLYWGDRSDRDQAVLSIRPMQTESGEEMGITTILGHKFDTTGVLGYSDGMRRAFPAWATIPSAKWLAMGRQWHLFFAWLFVLNGLIFTAYAFASRHATRDLAPTGKDLRGIGKSLSDHLLLRHPSGKEAKRYNVLQKLAYACILFGVARSTAYYQPTPVSDPVLALMRWIDELYLQYPFAGARMLRDLLRQEGHAIGRRRVATLMRRMGITAVYRTPCTTQRHPAHRIYPYSLRGLDIARPRHLPSNGSVNSWRHEAAIHGVHY
ncbi:MAG: hypothetical protein E8D42_05215 [Nitrospira sp.]|nr:MAG: hypothetical protein E8D42_05215 [Nitrospira sp.]